MKLSVYLVQFMMSPLRFVCVSDVDVEYLLVFNDDFNCPEGGWEFALSSSVVCWGGEGVVVVSSSLTVANPSLLDSMSKSSSSERLDGSLRD